jgi:hypothetical protein
MQSWSKATGKHYSKVKKEKLIGLMVEFASSSIFKNGLNRPKKDIVELAKEHKSRRSGTRREIIDSLLISPSKEVSHYALVNTMYMIAYMCSMFRL